MTVGPQARDFDSQACSFDRRAGLPLPAQKAIAIELVRMALLGPEHLVLEIGAGTGQIGRALCAMPIRYVGIDLSRLMLAEFASWGRHHACATPLVIADGSRQWPVRDGSATVIFGSRSLHLLPPAHLVQQACRVGAAERSYLIVGWTARDSNSLRARCRREMHANLVRRGYVVHDARVHTRKVLDAFVDLGGSLLPPRVAAAWSVRRNLREIIEGWRAVDGLAGVALPSDEKEAVLSDVAAVSKGMFGSLDVAETSEERYMLAAVEIVPRPSAGVAP